MMRRLITVVWLALSWSASAREVEVPLTFDFPFLREVLLAELFTEPNATSRVWQGDGGCSELVLSDPKVDGREGRLRILSLARARLGTAVAGVCTPWLDWQGQLEVFNEPSVRPRERGLTLRVVESNLYDANGNSESTAAQLWERIKAHVHPRLSGVRIRLDKPLQALEEVLPLLLPQPLSQSAAGLVATATPVAAEVKARGLELKIALLLPERPRGPLAAAPEPVLQTEELARWETAWQHWDAFLTHIIKQAARDTTLAPLRLALLEVLLDARYELVVALTQSTGGEPDPVRALLLRTWERLDPALRQLSAELPGEGALRYLSFIAAADALRAVDALGPELGLDISSDGLRRLARILAPQSSSDPLAYVTDVDPELRRLFGFVAPPTVLRPQSRSQLSDWFIPVARAANPSAQRLAARLDGWVPTRAEIGTYLPLVHQLLDRAAQDTLDSAKVHSDYRSLYRKLVLATAWQESCWRQFVRRKGRVRALRSGAGSVGIMQINVRVWRGFYDPRVLETDVGYNALAGSEILAHYLMDYAVKKGEHTKTGRREDLARATYAVYNGGPSHLRRYRQAKTPRTLKEIDDAFWTKYQTIAKGEEFAVAKCFGLSAPLQATAKAPPRQDDRDTSPLPKSSASRIGAPRASSQSDTARWLLRQDPREFTLQLVAAQDERSVRAYLVDHGLADRGRYFTFRRQGETWFAAVYGVYASRAEAQAVAKALAPRLPDSPWIRPLTDVHNAIRGGGAAR